MVNAVDVIEACYRLEDDENSWLDGIAESMAEAVGAPLGLFIYLDEGDRRALRFSRRFSPEWTGAFVDRIAEQPGAEGGLDQSLLANATRAVAPLLAGRCTSFSAVPTLAPMLPLLSSFGGARDLFTLNGFGPNGHGLSMAIPMRERAEPSRAQHQLLSRVTTHLAAAHRLRYRLRAQEGPDAVLDPSGALVDAQSSEAADARELLRRGALRLESARGKLRHDPQRATALWTGLVAARWTLLDDFSQSGKRYVLARRNELQVTVGMDALSQRERQILAHAAAGRSNKEIAYELGLAQPTVRVLMARAAGKLGVRGRDRAVERFRELARY